MAEKALINECWVWAAVDPDTDEMTVLGYMSKGGVHVPLIAIDPESANTNSVIAHAWHHEKVGTPDMYHFHFTNCEELEIVK